MTVARINGIDLTYTEDGPADGPPVVLVMGTGSPGRVWQLHQVPALVAHGHRVITFDNRGLTAADPAEFTLADMVADVAALIEHVGAAPAAVIGTSLGARIAVDLALDHPRLVGVVVALAAHGRLDPVRAALSRGEIALADQGITLPAAFHAAYTALTNLSPRTLEDDKQATDWLEVLEFGGGSTLHRYRGQLAAGEQAPSRLREYRDVRAPVLAVAFADDMSIPPRLVREVADAVPGSVYVEIADAGHFGYLERPAEVNQVILEFLAARSPIRHH